MNLVDKVKVAYEQKRLFRAVVNRSRNHLNRSVQLAFYHASRGRATSSHQISVHCPEYMAPLRSGEEIDLVARIFRSYQKMKTDQEKAPRLYRPSPLWEEQLNTAYSHLLSGLTQNNKDVFHFFLANFGTWKQYHGLESVTLIHENASSIIGRLYLKDIIFRRQLETWMWLTDNRKPFSVLTYPTHGNQAGAYIDGLFVGCGSFFNEIYGEILSGIVCDKKRPVVVDLGAGYGKLAYFTLRDVKNFTFIDFDLPEPLCLAAYYLMKTWPDKKALLYGEQDYSPQSHDEYDLIFMPAFEVEKLGERTVDLVINKNSLGEMTSEAVENYVHYIAKATEYFFHMNHEHQPCVYDDGTRGLLCHQFPVPMDNFKLLFRYPDIGHMLFRGGVDWNMDIFVYLYERRHGSISE